MTRYRIADEAIDVGELQAAAGARDGDCGGVATFLGVVRNSSAGTERVSGLFYEAFEPMALHEFERIGAEVRDRFGDVRIAIVHRRGSVAVGDIAVAVVAAATHRAEALDACRYAIDQLKERAPIWKREDYADGTHRWRANA